MTGSNGAPLQITIAGGPESSLYAVFATELKGYLESSFPQGYRFTTVPTVGSIENIERLLLDRNVMIAIAQEDVAHYFYTGRDNEFFRISREQDYRITALGRLFYEQFYFVTSDTISSVAELTSVSVGPRKSGTYATYTAYRDKQRPAWTEFHAEDPWPLLSNGTIDGFIEVEATPHRELFERRRQGARFALQNTPRTQFSLGLDIYQTRTIPDSLSPTGTPVETIAIPALLLCQRDGLPLEVAEAMLKLFYSAAVQNEHFPVSAWYLRQLAPASLEHGSRVAMTDQRFTSLPIPPHPATVQLTLGPRPYFTFIVAIALALLALAAVIALPRWGAETGAGSRVTQVLRTHRRYINLFLGAILWIALAALAIKFLEVQDLLAGRVVSGSVFIDYGLGQTLSWLLVFATSGFPTTPAGKLLAVSVQLVGIALIAYVGKDVLQVVLLRLIERKREMNKSNLSGHVVICNWNPAARELLTFLRAPDVPKARRARWIVLLGEHAMDDQDLEAVERLQAIRMVPWEENALVQARVEDADSIIILSPDIEGGTVANDGVVVRTALAIGAYLSDNEYARNRRRRVSIVAQTEDPQTIGLLEDIGVAEAIALKRMKMRLLAQAVHCPGVSDGYLELLDAKANSNEFHWCPLPRDLVDKRPPRFTDVLEYFKKTWNGNCPAVAIGMRFAPRENAGSQRDGYTLASQTQVLLNPTAETLARHGIDSFQINDEVLIVADVAPSI